MPDPAAITRRRALAAGAAAGLTLVAAPAQGWGAASAGLASFALGVERADWARGGGRQTGVLRAPRRFDLVGVRARGLAAADLQVRTRTRGGAWSPWRRFGLGLEHAPDRPRRPGASDPIWTGGADELQLRAPGGAPRGVRVDFVAVPASVRTSSAARLRAAPRQADATAGPPPIIPRTGWGGDKLPPRSPPEYGQVQMAFVHHTVNANDYGPEDSAGIVLAICKYHRDSNGWNDIGYNLLVDKYGQVFEGRAGGVDQAVIGAQAQGWNSQSTGIAALGTFEDDAFPAAGVAALGRLLGFKLSLHDVPTSGTVDLLSPGGDANRWPKGTVHTFERISGHRDGCSTTCPGATLYGQLGDLRERAGRAAGAVVGTPKLTIAPGAVEVAYGELAAFSGALVDGAGQPLGGVVVDLLKVGSDGKTYVPLTQVTTGPDGQWSVALGWKRSAAVRARATVPGASRVVQSTPVTVGLQTLVTLGRTSGRVLAGRAVRVSGTVLPAQAVSVRIERETTPGRYALVGEVPLKVTGTRFAGSVPLLRAGLYRLTVRTRTKAAGAAPISVRAVRRAADVKPVDAPLAPTTSR